MPHAALVWGGLTVVNGGFLLASSLKFFEGGFIPLLVGVAVFAVMATWRWGRKATFAAYQRQTDDDHARTGGTCIAPAPHYHRAQRAGDVAQALHSLDDRTPAR